MPEALSLEQIREACAGDCRIRLLPSVDSTNAWLLQEVRAGATLPLACFAEEQTRGRGRRGKTWVSSPGSAITMSLAWQFDVAVSEIGTLPLVMGIAVIQTLEKAGLAGAQLKWPNDVLVNNKKIAGILLETANITRNRVAVVIGIGLNYHLPQGLTDVPGQPWTDVCVQLAAGAEINRSQLAGDLLCHCIKLCERFPRERDWLLSEFREKYDVCKHKAVTVLLENGDQFQGVACGVSTAGEIRVLIDGEERMFNSADISLRKNTDES